jgi:hypothetical protein
MHMNTVKKTALAILLMAGTIPVMHAQGKHDYLHVPGPITFDGEVFYLSDTYHPQRYYYKQEYIPAGQQPDSFVSLFTIDDLVDTTTAKEAFKKKIAEIRAIKKTDPVAHYTGFEHPDKGEYLLDFVLSSVQNGALQLVEWDVYRYVDRKDKNGHTQTLCYAYSRRAYGANITPFMKDLINYKRHVTDYMTTYSLPEVRVSE